VRDRELDQIDLLALDFRQVGLPLQDDGVVAVGEVTYDDGGGIDTASSGNRQCINIW
jgi:hypothetical protein